MILYILPPFLNKAKADRANLLLTYSLIQFINFIGHFLQ